MCNKPVEQSLTSDTEVWLSSNDVLSQEPASERSYMFRAWISLVLVILLVPCTPPPVSAMPAVDKATKIQGQVEKISLGSVVEVRTKAKLKVRGRLGALTSKAFDVQTAIRDKVRTQSFRFDEVKSVKFIEKGLSVTAAAGEMPPTIREKVVVMPAGSIVEVRTKAKLKVRGRLGALTSEAFEVQTAKGGKIPTQSFRFDDVKSVKTVEHESTAVKIVVVAVVALAAVCVLGAVLVFAYGGY